MDALSALAHEATWLETAHRNAVRLGVESPDCLLGFALATGWVRRHAENGLPTIEDGVMMDRMEILRGYFYKQNSLYCGVNQSLGRLVHKWESTTPPTLADLATKAFTDHLAQS